MRNDKTNNLDLEKLQQKLDEALSNETSESLDGWLERKRMKNKQKEVDIAELAWKEYPFSNSERNAFISGYNKANEIHKENTIKLLNDEEIDNHVEDDFLNSTEVHKYSEEVQLLMKAMCKAGMKCMRDKIQGGNNEQQ
jgi:flagellar biosynthesis GTPase FlhF